MTQSVCSATFMALLNRLTALQAYFLVADDIMDRSITRRGQPCWYKVPDVGMVAINDGILLEQLIYFVLRKHFRSHPAYVDLIDLFLETTHQTAHGQLLDLITAPIGTVDLSKYTLSRCGLDRVLQCHVVHVRTHLSGGAVWSCVTPSVADSAEVH